MKRVGLEFRPGDLALSLMPLDGTGRSLVEPSGSFGGLRPPGNVAIGVDGAIYLLNRSEGRIKQFDPCACGFVPVPGVGGLGDSPGQFRDPRGIGLCRGRLFVCDTGHHHVRVLDAYRFTNRGTWTPPPSAKLAQPWQPYAIAFDGAGRGFVTDPANGMVHRFSPSGRWEAAFPGFGDVTWIAVDCADQPRVIVNGEPGVRTVNGDGQPIDPPTGRPIRPEFLAADFPRPPFPVDSSGNLHLAAFLPEACFPTPPPAGCGPAGPAPEPGVFDLNGNLVDPLSVALPSVPGFAIPALGLPSGVYISLALDSNLYQCQWHRVILQALVPKGTRLVVETFTSEALQSDLDIQNLPDDSWQTRLVVTSLDGEWDGPVRSGGGRFLWLRLRFDSNGIATPVVTRVIVEYPRISLRRYLPAVFGAEPVSADFTDRFLTLFDIVFRQIESTIDTQARFFDPMATPSTRDPRTGVDFLSWLAGWIGLSLSRSWPEKKRRRLLSEAGKLYNLRGTREGLRRQLLLYLGMEETDDLCSDALPEACCPPKPRNCFPKPPRKGWPPPPLILEHFRLRRWLTLGAGRLGDDAALWGRRIIGRTELGTEAKLGQTRLEPKADRDELLDPFRVDAHRFTVFVPACFGEDETGRRAIQTLIATESPAHTSFQVKYVAPFFRIGVQSTIGFDAVIGRAPQGVTLGQTALTGSNALTGPPGARGTEIGVGGRIGTMKLP